MHRYYEKSQKINSGFDLTPKVSDLLVEFFVLATPQVYSLVQPDAQPDLPYLKSQSSFSPLHVSNLINSPYLPLLRALICASLWVQRESWG